MIYLALTTFKNCISNFAFEVPEQLSATLQILNPDLDNLEWIPNQNKQGVSLELKNGALRFL